MPLLHEMNDVATVLLVDDDHRMTTLAARGLRRAGYEVVLADDGRSALEQAETSDVIDVIVLDIGIPGPDGLTVLRHLRDAGDQRPILLLTGRSGVADRVRGLNAGADDYLPKPFALDELAARLNSLVRRHQRRRSATITSGSIQVDPEARIVQRHGVGIDLTAREFDLLEFLVRNPRQVLTQDQILEHVWGIDDGGDSNLVTVYIKYLRDKVDRPFDVTSITTVRGLGYRWDPDDTSHSS